MKNIALSLILLSSLAGVAHAGGFEFAGDNQAPYRPGQADMTYSYPVVTAHKNKILNTQALAVEQSNGSQWLSGRYGLTTDPMEVRRWDEKNDHSSN